MLEPRGWHSRGYLPHFDDSNAVQLVGYRLNDALPAAALAKLKEAHTTSRAHQDAVEEYLHAGHGSCLLREPWCAQIVVDNWLRFDGTRYQLHAWTVMPNHVHVLVQPRAASLSDIVQSWKSYTLKLILRRASPGTFDGRRIWQPDYFDRFIRDPGHYAAAVDYIHENPVKAGLVFNAVDWSWSSARRGGSPPGLPEPHGGPAARAPT
jgi:REP element-mobilizing transposase RayT